MIPMKQLFTSAALFALISGSGFGLATAQEQSTQSGQAQSGQDQSGTETTQDSEAPAGSTAQETSPGSQGDAAADSAAEQNRLVATVNDAEIREQDVLSAMRGLPPHLQQMPRQTLLPLIVQQLFTRHLILEQGKLQNLAADPEVVARVAEQMQAVEDRAVVNVWFEREIAERITEERISKAYGEFKAANPDSTATLDAARPQLQQTLRQDIMNEIAAELQKGAVIVFYDVNGDPIPEGEPQGKPEAAGEKP